MKYQCFPHIETSQLICTINQLTGFYMRATLALNGLTTSRLELEKRLLPYFKSAFFNFSSFEVSYKKKYKFLNLGPEMLFSDSI